ncbi:MAG: hypothetical protein AB1921_16850 [Thermodesulfobacteriota bacterium]
MQAENTVSKWRPREKPFKRLVISASMFALGSALEAAAAWDPEVRSEVESWRDPLAILMEVKPNGPYMALEKRDGVLRYLGPDKISADLVISFKTVEGAFLVMSGQIGTPQSYAEHRATLSGDASQAMSLIRCLTIVQAFLFPRILAERVLKRVPEMPPKRMMIRAAVLGAGIPRAIPRLF